MNQKTAIYEKMMTAKRAGAERPGWTKSSTALDDRKIAALIAELRELRRDLLRVEKEFEPHLARYTTHRKSALNLIHYLGLRSHDIRRLQEKLAALGLSSLGRTESHVLAGIESVLKVLQRLARESRELISQHDNAVDFAEGNWLLRTNTNALLGAPPAQRSVRIMVTVPNEAAHDYDFVRNLLAGGMECMRINCAHDSADAWLGMLRNLEKAKKELGRECRVEMDLSGPKLRTGSINPATQILKWRPQRDENGRVRNPARLWITPRESPESTDEVVVASLRVPGAGLARIQRGDRLQFRDLRGRKRLLRVNHRVGNSHTADLDRTAYINAGDPLELAVIHQRAGADRIKLEAAIDPSANPAILVRPGETLLLTRDQIPGRPALCDGEGGPLRPAAIACTLPEVFPDLRSGEKIWFDDGKIGGTIEAVSPDEVRVRITIARPGGDRLGADKGINVPESTLHLPALTSKDIADLKFVAQHADIVGLSFVRRAEDVTALQEELTRLGAREMGIVIKIETRTAFEHLPAILLEAMRGRHVGIMIARGDLAVECGWQRLAEVQEEILWVCEAAHVPVIWATQVLENLAKKGTPSRAEITDAAMGERAECVMLNKGPHLLEAVRILDGILCRMEAHQNKKSARLRRLHLSTFANLPGPAAKRPDVPNAGSGKDIQPDGNR